MDLSNKVFGSNVDPKIRKYFEDLQKGSFTAEPNESLVKPGNVVSMPDYTTYLGDRNPYARMWTAVNISEPDKEDKGENKVFVINENRDTRGTNLDYSELDSINADFFSTDYSTGVDRKYESQKNTYLKPKAGIISINSKSEGAVGALRRTTVEFIVHNKNDFDTIFLPFFLKPGSHVFVDFGWSDKALNLYDPTDFIYNRDLELDGLLKDLYNTKDKQKGLTTTLNGQVLKYDVSVDQNQSFRCTLEFVSSNYHLLDKEVSDDNNLKFIFDNAIEELLLGYYIKATAGDKGIEEPELDIDATITDILDLELMNVIPAEERKKLIKEYFDADISVNRVQNGVINETAKKLGIFYNNLSQDEESSLNKKESLYISFGLFEDKFLNNFVSYWQNEDGTERNPNQNVNLPKFSSVNSYVRFDNNLLNMMKAPLQSDDEVTSFLYPDTWDNTYNKFKPVDSSENNITLNDKDKRRIPLRELFISVPIISEAFKRSANVNDALEFIFNRIYQDSANIINIKLVKNNEAETSLTFHDVNVLPVVEDNDEILTFDLTSGNTVVQNVDLKFETPKAGLSSMIAIGTLSEPQIFDELELMKFNLLNALQSSGNKKQVRHLPIFGEKNDNKELVLDVDINKVIGGQSSVRANVDFYGGTKPRSLSERHKKFKETRDEIIEKLKTESEVKDIRDEKKPKTEGDEIIYTASSDRDVFFTQAKILNLAKTDDNSISPVLPISLTLEVYGNNFLSIGDYFTVNFLPKHWQERVYFQIVGVDHAVGTSNWKTSYTTVMRLKSNKKYFQFGNDKASDLAKRVVIKLSDAGQTQKLRDVFLKSPISNNTYLLNMLVDSGPVESGIITSDRGKSGLAGEESKIQVNFFTFKFDRNKDKKKNKVNKGNIKTVPFVSNIPEELTPGSLVFYMEVCNAILSEDYFDWPTYVKDYEEAGPPVIKPAVKTGPFNTNAQIKKNEPFRKPNEILCVRQKGLLNTEASNSYQNLILERLDHLYTSYGFLGLGSELFVTDSIQNAIHKYIQIEAKYQTKKIKEGNFEIAFDIEADQLGFVFVLGLYWGLRDNPDLNEFQIIQLKGLDDSKIFPSLIFPKKYLKVEPLEMIKKVHKKYQSNRIALDSIVEMEIENRRKKDFTLEDAEELLDEATETATEYLPEWAKSWLGLDEDGGGAG